MPDINKEEIVKYLTRLGELAIEESTNVELVLMGGGLMVMAYDARPSTHDLDVLILKPESANHLRILAARVAKEFDLELDWLNDAAKGFLNGLEIGSVLLEEKGIRVFGLAPAQMLAMKLAAWRDPRDVADARRLLKAMPEQMTREEIWSRIEPFLIPGKLDKARYALEDIWEEAHGTD